jgi:hypothetical protein
MSAVELPVLAPAPQARYAAVARKVEFLSWLSLAWMTVEGAVAITAGIIASSIALVGFDLDSVIEGVASLIIIWRFTGDRVFSHDAEQRAQKLVAIQFFFLAPYVGVESIRALADGEHPGVSVLGIALSVGSLVFMPMLGSPRNGLPTRSVRRRPRVRAARTCSAPTSRERSSSACSATRSSAPGGWTRRSAC